MKCDRRPSEVIVDVVAADGGWLWLCRQCWGRSKDPMNIIGKVERANV